MAGAGRLTTSITAQPAREKLQASKLKIRTSGVPRRFQLRLRIVLLLFLGTTNHVSDYRSEQSKSWRNVLNVISCENKYQGTYYYCCKDEIFCDVIRRKSLRFE